MYSKEESPVSSTKHDVYDVSLTSKAMYSVLLKVLYVMNLSLSSGLQYHLLIYDLDTYILKLNFLTSSAYGEKKYQHSYLLKLVIILTSL